MKRARALEDKLEALHVYFALEKTHTGGELRHAKEDLRKKATELGRGLKLTKEVTARDLKAIGQDIRKRSEIMWECLKVFMQYIETEEQRLKREEMEKKIVD